MEEEIRGYDKEEEMCHLIISLFALLGFTFIEAKRVLDKLSITYPHR